MLQGDDAGARGHGAFHFHIGHDRAGVGGRGAEGGDKGAQHGLTEIGRSDSVHDVTSVLLKSSPIRGEVAFSHLEGRNGNVVHSART